MDDWIVTMVSGTRNYILEVYGNILIKWKYGIPLPKKEKKCLEQEKCQL